MFQSYVLTSRDNSYADDETRLLVFYIDRCSVVVRFTIRRCSGFPCWVVEPNERLNHSGSPDHTVGSTVPYTNPNHHVQGRVFGPLFVLNSLRVNCRFIGLCILFGYFCLFVSCFVCCWYFMISLPTPPHRAAAMRHKQRTLCNDGSLLTASGLLVASRTLTAFSSA